MSSHETAGFKVLDSPAGGPSFPATTDEQKDLLITAVEPNLRHGVGVLLRRLFPDSRDFVCLRSFSVYNGETDFGSANECLVKRPRHPDDFRAAIAAILSKWRIRRILCVPYYDADFQHGVLAHEITGAPLVTFIMDDQNIFARNVPDILVERLLSVSTLRLGISWELCKAYEAKFGFAFVLFPPVVGERGRFVPNFWQSTPGEPTRAAMIGNVWTATQFRRLRGTLRKAQLKVDWYGNGHEANWLEGDLDDWEKDGIRCFGYLPEEDLISAIASYPYVLIPSGTCDAKDDNPAFSWLSLPSRLLFLHANTDTPVLVCGAEIGAAGHFVTRNGTGLCSTADPDGLREVHDRLVSLAVRNSMRLKIRKISPTLTLAEGGKWIWSLLEDNTAASAPFQLAFSPPDNERVKQIENAVKCVSGLSAGSSPQRKTELRQEPVYATNRLVSTLSAAGLLDGRIENVELVRFMRAFAAWELSRVSQPGADVLHLGGNLTPEEESLLSGLKVWQLNDLGALLNGRRASYRALNGLKWRPRPLRFDAVWSTNLSDLMPEEPAACRTIAHYCHRIAAPRAVNLHLFPAIVHREYNWVHPLCDAMSRVLPQPDLWKGFAPLLEDPDAFFMSKAAYDQHWRPYCGKDSENFGRCSWLGISWRRGPLTSVLYESLGRRFPRIIPLVEPGKKVFISHS